MDTSLQLTQYNSKIGFNKYGLFAQVSRKFAKDKLGLSLGLRFDGNDYNSETKNLFAQVSPRFSISYALTPALTINANTGIYYQLPPYTVLGYKEDGQFINRTNGVEYIRNIQAVGGLAYITSFNAKFSVEGFYKWYDNYPLLVQDGISLANLGGDFGVIGAEEAISTSQGKTYGVEFLFQQKLYKGFYSIVTYTFYRSLFTNADGNYTSSGWDNRHIVTLVGGKKFKKNWEIGARWTFYGGAPYTPFDIDYSVQIPVWTVNNEGILDYNQINSERLKPVHRLDVRVDKKWFFNKWNLNLYLDITNIYNNQARGNDQLTVERDEVGQPIVDPDNPNQYIPKLIENTNGNLIPTIGVVLAY
ncbi:MAG: TonB-dependent receptor [Chitinophagales bacterium]